MIAKFAVLVLSPMLILAASKGPSPTAKKTTAKATSKSKSLKTSTATVAHSYTRRGRRRIAARRAAGPSYQTHPTDERYKEIQQALADKGYFKGPVDGQWNADSVDSLKRFQTDHQISNDGKVNSLSLIQLGLGPKRDAVSTLPIPSPAAPGTAGPSSPAPATTNPAPPAEDPQQNITASQ